MEIQCIDGWKVEYDTLDGRESLGNRNKEKVWNVDGNYCGGWWDNRRLGIPEHRGGADKNKWYWRWFSEGLTVG